MRKILIIMALALLVAGINSCGGGGSSSSSPGKTSVTINLGQTRAASNTFGRLIRSSSTIPSSVVSIRFIISATDMTAIERVISVEGRVAITESFDVPNGSNRHFVVEAMDASGNVLYRGETYADLDGRPLILTITMVSTDKTPPAFAGLSSIGSATTTTLTLSWSDATDNITPKEKIQYLIYMSTTPGGENLSSPSFTTQAGAISYTVTGLSPDTAYYFIARAMDEAGNIDSNTAEKSARTLAPPDTTAPTFGGIVSATALSPTEITLTWNPATDNRTSSSNIVYLIYMSTTSGGQNLAIPTTTVTGSTSITISGLTPETTYYFIVRAKDEAGNIDSNTVEKSATTLTLRDTTAPTFGGVVSATAASSTEIKLTWSAATDNRTSSSNIVYLVYMSITSGGENLAIPTTYVTGATSVTISGLTPETTYYFIVRAKDEAGNIDSNTVEKSATTLILVVDTTPPTFGGITSVAPLSATEISLAWNPATDNRTSSSNMIYLIYKSTTSGGQNFSSPKYTTSPGVASYVANGLSPSTTYYFVVRAKDEAGNIDTNNIVKSATTLTAGGGTGNISGTVVDALTGTGVCCVTINLRAGKDVTTGTVVTSTITQSDGSYSFTGLDAGDYTAEVSGSGYITTYANLVCVSGATTANQNITITPALSAGETRIVLTWGATPFDLDSHLTGPAPDGSRFHIYFGYKAYIYSGATYAALDLDDTYSYGPETTTIYKQISGVYRFSVHDYSNALSSYSLELARSNATVMVYQGNSLAATFTVPNQAGTLWTVFELDGVTITPINTMSYESDELRIQMPARSDAFLIRKLPLKK